MKGDLSSPLDSEESIGSVVGLYRIHPLLFMLKFQRVDLNARASPLSFLR